MKGLTIKQENFCNYYIESGNTSDAYRRAYSCEKMKDKQVWEESCKLLSNPKVAQRVKELQEEQKNKATESEIQEEGKIQDVSEEQPESEVQIKEEKKMSDFTVSINDLKVKVDTLRQLNAQFKSQVGELEATESNLNGMWEGEAKDTFHNAFTSDKTQMNNFYNAVEVYAQRLESIAARYAQAEANNVEIASERTY